MELGPARWAVRNRLRRLSEESPQPKPKSTAWIGVEKIRDFVDDVVGKTAERYPMSEAAAEFAVFGSYMSVQSVRWFRFGAVATYFAARLIIFAILLLPVFMRMAYRYFRDPRIQRRVRFGPNRRNYCDIYSPPEAAAAIAGSGEPVPVVVAIMGGAWIIGHRAWNTQLGLRLTEAGVMVVAIDYRNFPLGEVPDMVEDLTRGLGWVFANIHKYGGDPNNMALIGQSAGAHLSALLLLERGLMEAREAQEPPANAKQSDGIAHCDASKHWSVQSLKGCLLVSGPYDLVELEEHLDRRGLYSRILRNFCVNGDLVGCSPARLLDSEEWKAVQERAAQRIPRIHLLHGTADKSVPVSSTVRFAELLRAAGVEVETDLRKGVAHSEIVVEGPMRGEEFQVEPLLPFLFGNEGPKRLKAMPELRPMYPREIIAVASRIMPF